MGLNLSNSHENEGAGQDFREYGGWGARENFLRFYKMPFKYKLTGGGEVKLYYYAMKESMGGGPSKTRS